MQAAITDKTTTIGNHHTCYACNRFFHEDDLGLCPVCGVDLCLLPCCSDKCKCDEEAERTGNPPAYKQDAA
jgi:hypothetical protein